MAWGEHIHLGRLVRRAQRRSWAASAEFPPRLPTRRLALVSRGPAALDASPDFELMPSR